MREEIQELKNQLTQLQVSKEQTKTSFVESLCALPFDRILYMVPFPRDIEVPKYDKYDGNGDPHDNIRKLYAHRMDFVQEDTYLMRLFPKKINGQVMEWFTKISPPLKYFDDLVQLCIQHYSYNIQHAITMLDLCNIKQKQGESFVTYL